MSRTQRQFVLGESMAKVKVGSIYRFADFDYPNVVGDYKVVWQRGNKVGVRRQFELLKGEGGIQVFDSSHFTEGRRVR